MAAPRTRPQPPPLPALTEDERAAIGERFKSTRVAAGVTVQALADKVGVSRQSVIAWQAGTVPAERHRMKIAKVLKTLPDKLWPEEFDRLERIRAAGA